MLVKAILVFLLAMALVGMTFKALTSQRRKPPALDHLRCATCGRIHTQTPPVRCDRPDCGTR